MLSHLSPHLSLCLSLLTVSACHLIVTSWWGQFGLQLSWDPAELILGEFQGGGPTGMWIWVKLKGKAENFLEPQTPSWHREGWKLS